MKKSLSQNNFARSGALFAKRLFLPLAIAALGGLSQPAQAAALIDLAIFGDGDVSVTSPDATVYGAVHTNGNFATSGGSTVYGGVSAVGTVTNDIGNPSFLLGGSTAGAGTRTYPNMTTVLAAIGAPYTEITPAGGTLYYSGNQTFSGVYWVHGNVDISTDINLMRTATFLADGDIDVSNGTLSSAVKNSSFPYGLALYSGGGHVTVSGASVSGSVAGKTTVDISGQTQVPEPSSAMLLGLGGIGAAVLRKRKRA